MKHIIRFIHLCCLPALIAMLDANVCAQTPQCYSMMENNRFWNITATVDSGQTLHAMIPTAFDSTLAIQRMFGETSWYQRQNMSDYGTRRERYEKAIMDIVLLSEWDLERQRTLQKSFYDGLPQPVKDSVVGTTVKRWIDSRLDPNTSLSNLAAGFDFATDFYGGIGDVTELALAYRGSSIPQQVDVFQGTPWAVYGDSGIWAQTRHYLEPIAEFTDAVNRIAAFINLSRDLQEVIIASGWQTLMANQYALERLQAFKPTIQNTVLWNDGAFQEALYAVERYLQMSTTKQYAIALADNFGANIVGLINNTITVAGTSAGALAVQTVNGMLAAAGYATLSTAAATTIGVAVILASPFIFDGLDASRHFKYAELSACTGVIGRELCGQAQFNPVLRGMSAYAISASVRNLLRAWDNEPDLVARSVIKPDANRATWEAIHSEMLNAVAFEFDNIPKVTLTVKTSGIGSVRISMSPLDINGKSSDYTQFTASYPVGATVTLSAPSQIGSDTFSRWIGTAAANSGVVSMSANKTVTAEYVELLATQGNDLSIYSKGWDDTSGNGDEDDVMEGWEDVDLILWLKSTASIQNVRGTLSSSLGDLNISDAEDYWPDITANANARCNGNFDMFLNRDSYSSIPFTLRVDYEKNGLPYYQNLTFTKSFYRNGLYNADFDVVGWTINDATSISTRNNGDGIFQSGENVRLIPQVRNVGSADATSVYASICYSNAAQLELCETEHYGDMRENQTISTELFSAHAARSFAGSVCLDVLFTWDQNTNGVLKSCEITLPIQPEAWLNMPEEQFDFGVASPGSSITHTTLVQNIGSEDLHITNIITSAADTTWLGSPLPWTVSPGQSTNLVVSINTSNLIGQLSRSVKVQGDGRVPTPGEDDMLYISGLVSDSVPVFTIASTTNVSCGDPDISGEWIVWSDNRNGNSDIFAFNTTTLEEIALCTNSAAQSYPRVSGGLVVWVDYRNDPVTPRNRDLYGFDLSNPQLGEFPVSTNSADEFLRGVDTNLVAFYRVYESLPEPPGTPDDACNLIVLQHNGNGQFSTKYTSGYTPGSGTASRFSAGEAGDFGGKYLVYRKYENYWTGTSWNQRNYEMWILDFSQASPTPRLALSDLVYPYAEAKRFIYVEWDGNNDDQIFMWKDNGSVSQLTSAGDLSPGDDSLAMGGPDGQEVLLYDYGDSTARPGLYAMDRGNSSLESVVSFSDDPEDVRMDGYAAVWVGNRLANSPIKYAFFRQSDIAINSASLSVTPNPLDEGQPFSLSGTVRNLSPTPCASAITVRVYDGNPNAGGQQLGNDVVIGGGLGATASQVVTFTNLGPLPDGQHQIHVKASTSAADYPGNNVALISVDVEDADDNGPLITASSVTEVDGDGDGLIGTDEDAQLNLVISDLSGVGSVQVFLNGTEKSISGPLTNCTAALGRLSVGQHNLEIRATDADLTPSSRTNFLSFAVVSAERMAVTFGGTSITSGQTQPVDLGLHEVGSVASPIFIVENGGQQLLTISNISVTGSFSSSGPLTSEIHPSGLTSFIVRPSTTAVGSYTGMVTVASSDALANPYSFPVRATVTLPKPPLLPLPSSLAGPFRFQFATVPGLHYFIEASTNLVTWETVLTTNATMNLVEFVETNMSARPQRFYRVRVQSGASQPSVSFQKTGETSIGSHASVGLSPDNTKLYAAIWEDQNNSRVLEYALPSMSLLQTLTFGSYHTHGDVVVSADGCRIFTPNYYPDNVSQINLCAGNARLDLSTTTTWPADIDITPDRTKIVVATGRDGQPYDQNNDGLAIYDISGTNFASLAFVGLNDEPAGHKLAFSADGQFVYVPTKQRKSATPMLYEVSLTSPYQVTRSMAIPSTELRGVACAGNTVYVSDYTGSQLWVVNRTSWTKTAHSLDSAPGTIAMHPNGQHLFVLQPSAQRALALDAASLDVMGSIDGLAVNPHDIEFNNAGTRLYLSHGSGYIYVYDVLP